MQHQQVEPSGQGGSSVPARSTPLRVAIIGAGPLGIEAAQYAVSLGFSVRLFEAQQEIAPTVRQWPHLNMFSPWSQLRTSLGLNILAAHSGPLSRQAPADPLSELPERGTRSYHVSGGALHPTAEEFVRLYLEPLANALPAKTLHLGCKVTGITRAYLSPTDHNELPTLRARHPFRIMTRNVETSEERAWSTEFVLDCTSGGRVPGWLGCGGLPAIGEMGCTHQVYRHTPDILGKDRGEFAGKKTLLVGDGTSAATSAIMLAELAETQEDTQFYWAVKSSRDLPCASEAAIEPAMKRPIAMDKANLLVKSGKPYLAYSKRTQVEEIRYSVHSKKFLVTLQVDRQTKRYQFDNVIANVGARQEQAYLRLLVPNEPGFFMVGGEDCTPPESYLVTGHLQIRDTFREILGDRSVDLYSSSMKAA